MANITAATGTYAGKLALPYVKAALLSSDTLSNNWCKILPNVVGTVALRKFSGGAIRTRTCGFAGQSGITLGEVPLATAKLEVKAELCHDDLAATWEADLMSDSLTAPADTKAAMLNYIVELAANDVEANLWQGLYDYTDQGQDGNALLGFGGFLSKVVAAGTAIGNDDALTGATTVSGTTVATRILERLAALVGGAPSKIHAQPNRKIFMSHGMKMLYYRAMAETHGPVLGEVVNSFSGIEIVTPGGMPDDAFLYTATDNLAFGTDLSGNDFSTQAAVKDLNESTLEDVVRGMIAFTAGTAIIDPSAVSFAGRTS